MRLIANNIFEKAFLLFWIFSDWSNFWFIWTDSYNSNNDKGINNKVRSVKVPQSGQQMDTKELPKQPDNFKLFLSRYVSGELLWRILWCSL